jgi:hypothetical protein
MSEYVLLYRNTAEAREAAMGTPERTQASMARWRSWMETLAANGQLKNRGIALEMRSQVVRAPKSKPIDGPFAETKEVVGGFSVIEARDIEHAAEIAAGCPIVQSGGSVEVRPVKPIPV